MPPKKRITDPTREANPTRRSGRLESSATTSPKHPQTRSTTTRSKAEPPVAKSASTARSTRSTTRLAPPESVHPRSETRPRPRPRQRPQARSSTPTAQEVDDTFVSTRRGFLDVPSRGGNLAEPSPTADAECGPDHVMHASDPLEDIPEESHETPDDRPSNDQGSLEDDRKENESDKNDDDKAESKEDNDDDEDLGRVEGKVDNDDEQDGTNDNQEDGDEQDSSEEDSDEEDSDEEDSDEEGSDEEDLDDEEDTGEGADDSDEYVEGGDTEPEEDSDEEADKRAGDNEGYVDGGESESEGEVLEGDLNNYQEGLDDGPEDVVYGEGPHDGSVQPQSPPTADTPSPRPSSRRPKPSKVSRSQTKGKAKCLDPPDSESPSDDGQDPFVGFDSEGEEAVGGDLSTRAKTKAIAANKKYKSVLKAIAKEDRKTTEQVHQLGAHILILYLVPRNEVVPYLRKEYQKHFDVLGQARDDPEAQREHMQPILSWYSSHLAEYIGRHANKPKMKKIVRKSAKQFTDMSEQLQESTGLHAVGFIINSKNPGSSISWGTELFRELRDEFPSDIATAIRDLESRFHLLESKKRRDESLGQDAQPLPFSLDRRHREKLQDYWTRIFGDFLRLDLRELGKDEKRFQWNNFFNWAYREKVRIEGYPRNLPVEPGHSKLKLIPTEYAKQFVKARIQDWNGEEVTEGPVIKVVSWTDEEAKLPLKSQAKVALFRDDNGEDVKTVYHASKYIEDVAELDAPKRSGKKNARRPPNAQNVQVPRSFPPPPSLARDSERSPGPTPTIFEHLPTHSDNEDDNEEDMEHATTPINHTVHTHQDEDLESSSGHKSDDPDHDHQRSAVGRDNGPAVAPRPRTTHTVEEALPRRAAKPSVNPLQQFHQPQPRQSGATKPQRQQLNRATPVDDDEPDDEPVFDQPDHDVAGPTYSTAQGPPRAFTRAPSLQPGVPYYGYGVHPPNPYSRVQQPPLDHQSHDEMRPAYGEPFGHYQYPLHFDHQFANPDWRMMPMGDARRGYGYMPPHYQNANYAESMPAPHPEFEPDRGIKRRKQHDGAPVPSSSRPKPTSRPVQSQFAPPTRNASLATSQPFASSRPPVFTQVRRSNVDGPVTVTSQKRKHRDQD